MLKDYFVIALGGLRKRFLRTSLTMLGIFIGIAAVVALISLGQGMQDAINQQFASIGTDKITVQGVQAGFGPPGELSAGKVTEDDLKLVRSVPGIQRAAGRLLRSVTVEHGDEVEVFFAGSIPEEAEDRDLVLESLDVEVAHGRLLKSGETGKLVVGSGIWDDNEFRKPIVVGTKLLLNGKSYEVVGLLDKGAAFINNAILLNANDLKELTGAGDELSAIVAQVVAGEVPSAVADRVLRAMRRDRHQKEGFEDVTVETSEELINSVNTILGVVQAVFIGIAAISLLVGGIGIMNTMYTSVLERTRDIGIMKAIGARNSDVMWIFLLESGLLGMAGGAVGIALGVGLSKLVEFVGQDFAGSLLKASFPLSLILGALLFSFLIGTISGVFPARQASKLPPVDALRGD
ncbi:MAG: ABC transporter permease [Candidatus Woesearchaeota archaeon]